MTREEVHQKLGITIKLAFDFPQALHGVQWKNIHTDYSLPKSWDTLALTYNYPKGSVLHSVEELGEGAFIMKYTDPAGRERDILIGHMMAGCLRLHQIGEMNTGFQTKPNCIMMPAHRWGKKNAS